MSGAVVTAVLGPWRRVVDGGRAGKPDPDALRDARDVVLAPTGAAVSRPGIHALASHPGTPGEAQGLASVELAGTVYTLAVVGGVLASYDWTAASWAPIPHAGTTINVTGAVAVVGVFDELVVSDGVNRPWRTTIGSGVGTYLPTSGPLYGLPVVKDAKLFGILANSRRELVWSEEADLATGFDTGGYNNAWDLRQTSQAALVALRADNAALRYQREGSSGMVLGQVNDDFQASGTFDDLAKHFGTVSPFASVLTEGGTLWSLDRLGRPYRVAPGTGVDTLWLAAEHTVATVDRDRLAFAWAAFVDDGDAVVFAVPRTAGSLRNTDLLRFDRATGDYVGRWTLPGGGDWAWGAPCTGDDGVTRLCALDHAGGFFVVWTDAEADADPTKALDLTADGAALPPARVVTAEAQEAGAEQVAWCQWTEVVVETGDPFGGSVPPVQRTATTLPVSRGTSLAFDTEDPGHRFDTTDPRTLTVGPAGRGTHSLKRWGRWLRTAWWPAEGTGSERFRLHRVTVRGVARDTGSRRR